MRPGRLCTLALSAAIGCALLVAAFATAALPTPTKARVVPFKSMGAVKFGITKATAVEKWGQPQCAHEDTTGQDTCVWLSTSPSDFPPEGTAVQLKGGKVCGMMMRAGTDFHDGTL